MLTARCPCGTGESRYRCFLPDLTEFTGPPCTGPNYQHSTSARNEISPNPMLLEKQYLDHWAVSRFPACRGRLNRKRPMSPPDSGTMAEREGFEPSVPFWGTHDFQSCAFNRSATSPYWHIANLRPCSAGSTVNVCKMSPRSFFWVVLLSCCFQKLTQAFAVAKTECETRDFKP